jgi:predicted glycoside hydrolase/deacetylase ChbG (UPF0249 family)
MTVAIPAFNPDTDFRNRESARQLILHADDFGMSAAVNSGIVTGFSEGLLTSTSMLANAPAMEGACIAWRILERTRLAGKLASSAVRNLLGDDGSHPFDLGVHLNLTQGMPLTGSAYPAPLLDREGRFPGIFPLLARLLSGGTRYRLPIQRELEAQITRVAASGLSLTHLNGHQYVEMLPVVSGIVPELLQRFGISTIRVARERGLAATTLWHRFRPHHWGLAQVKRAFANRFARNMQRCGADYAEDYFGTAHAGTIDVKIVHRFLVASRARVVEIGLHPGAVGVIPDFHVEEGWSDPLAHLRPGELEMLCGPELPALLQGSNLRLGRLGRSTAHMLRRAA